MGWLRRRAWWWRRRATRASRGWGGRLGCLGCLCCEPLALDLLARLILASNRLLAQDLGREYLGLRTGGQRYSSEVIVLDLTLETPWLENAMRAAGRSGTLHVLLVLGEGRVVDHLVRDKSPVGSRCTRLGRGARGEQHSVCAPAGRRQATWSGGSQRDPRRPAARPLRPWRGRDERVASLRVYGVASLGSCG